MMFNKLTHREQQVASLLALGSSRSAIARTLGISSRTVDTHRHQLLDKLHARNVADLVRIAIRDGVISMHDDETATDDAA